MQGCRTLPEVISRHQIGSYSVAGLFWDVAGGEGQHALNAHVQAAGSLGSPESVFKVPPKQIKGVAPAVPTASDVAMQQGEGRRGAAWTVVGDAARQWWHKGQGGLLRQVTAHVDLGIDARLNATNKLQNQSTAMDNRATAL